VTHFEPVKHAAISQDGNWLVYIRDASTIVYTNLVFRRDESYCELCEIKSWKILSEEDVEKGAALDRVIITTNNLAIVTNQDNVYLL
jgi:hypothetical protein